MIWGFVKVLLKMTFFDTKNIKRKQKIENSILVTNTRRIFLSFSKLSFQKEERL